MADYHSLLTRAVANLPSGGTPATREAIYVRARKALIEQLRSLRPPLPESDIAREANALDAAIAQIEARYGSQYAAPSSAPSPPAAPSDLAPRRQAGRFAAAFAETRRADRARPARSFPAPGYARIPAERADGGVSRSVREPVATAVPSRVASAAGRIRSTVRSAANTAANIAAPSAPAGLGAGEPGRCACGQAGRRRSAGGAAGSASTRRCRSQTGVIPWGEEQRHVLGDWDERRQRGQFPAAARSRQVGSVEVGG